MPIKSIKIKIPQELQAAFKDPETSINKKFQRGIEDAAIAIQGEIKRNIVPGWGMGHATKPKPYFTGTLNRSIIYQMSPLKAIVGANTVYAAIQELGGEIRPVRAKALFVPISVEGRKVGPQRSGSNLVYGKDFIFCQKVTIKPKHYFERGVDNAMDKIVSILDSTVKSITLEWGFK